LRAQGVLSAWMTCALRWYCKGASGVLSSASQPAGDERPPHRRRKLARCWTRSLLRLFLIVPLALATQFRCVCPECSSGNPAGDLPAEARLWTSLVEPWQPRPRAVCKPELAAHHAELCCCTSQRAPRPAFNPHTYQLCCLLVRREGGKSGAVRGGGMPKCALRRIIHPPLVVSSSIWLHELAASRLTALRERPCTGRGWELLASSFTVRKGI
jgi:hypothetical protein